MKTVLFLAAMFAATVSFAQKSKVIETEDGKMLVHYNEQKQQYIDFDLELWNEIFTDNFIDIRVSGTWTIEICVRIATRRSGCTTGIGFRCKNCNHALIIKSPEIKYAPVEATGVYQYLPKENKVRLTFDRYIDWDKLAKS